jgi:DNA-binding CsgD family transcriptional regulator
MFDFRSGGRRETVIWMTMQRSEPEPASPKGGTGIALQGDPVIAVLSPAERKVLEQLRTYRTLKEIGERLLISRTTVKTHVASIYSKLGVTGRAEAVAFLTEDSSLDPDS